MAAGQTSGDGLFSSIWGRGQSSCRDVIAERLTPADAIERPVTICVRGFLCFRHMYLFGVLTGFTTKTPRHEEDTKEIHVLPIHPVSSDQETILEIVMLNEVKNLRAGLGGDSSLLFGRSE